MLRRDVLLAELHPPFARLRSLKIKKLVVGPTGIEPVTPALSAQCSTN